MKARWAWNRILGVTGIQVMLVFLGSGLWAIGQVSQTVWQPDLNTSWQWQLSTPVDQTVDASVYDIDLFHNSAGVVASLHAAGRKVICYVNMGAWQQGYPDANQFPESVKGEVYKGFPDERWLDIRAIAVLGPIIKARLDLAKLMGCDGVEPDNLDGYDTTAHEPSGFPLSYQDQITYNLFIASEAHARGLSVGLKNDINQVQDLVSFFNFSVNEQCFEYSECDTLLPFISAGKPVFEAEYGLSTDQFCDMANALNFNSIKKRPELDAFRVACR